MANRPDPSRRSFLDVRFQLALLSALLLSSCLDLSAALEIRPDGSGRMELDYSMPSVLGNLDADGDTRRYLPLPAERQGFETLVADLDGLRLESWERTVLEPTTAGVERFRIRAAVSFDAPASLAAFAAAASGGEVRGGTSDARGFELVLNPGRGPVDGGFLAFLAAAFPEAACSFTVRLPARGTSNRGAFDAAGTTLSWSLPLQEILSARDILEWTVRW
ncbi:MAG: hypothetical protein JXA15_14700 [Spirochaetales bacterium]|nr:hypothetical protein [Spirochaetales bacterium]